VLEDEAKAKLPEVPTGIPAAAPAAKQEEEEVSIAEEERVLAES
jgi:hypothetical protein